MTEMLMLFAEVVAEDHSVLDFIDPGYSWMNSTLCLLYGIDPKVESGEERPNSQFWYKYKLDDRRRGGILASGAALMVNSNPSRTNPVKRGKWILESVLNTPPPPPLPDVPALDDIPAGQNGISLRRKLELHRSSPACAGCHKRLDPLGLALENYDAVGVWRDMEDTEHIDARGELIDGTTFEGPIGLKDLVLNEKREFFVNSLTNHLMIYALGRPTEYYDISVIREIGDKVAEDEYKMSRMIVEIVKSYPFRYTKNANP